MTSLTQLGWKRITAGLVLVLVIAQLASWLFAGQSQLCRKVVAEINALTQEELIVNWECLAAIPSGSASELLAELSEDHKVWQEHDVPSAYYEVLGLTGDGRQHRAYRQGIRLCYSRFTSTPIYAKVEFSLFRAPLAARGYELRYVWVFGNWIQLPTSNPTWRS